MSDATNSSATIQLGPVRHIGVLADTHIPHRLKGMPPRVYEALKGSDAILHAGDLEDPAILDMLRKIAPAYAVRGNLHWQFSTGTHDQNLPLSLTLSTGRHTIWMTHGHFSFGYSVIDKVVGIGVRRSLSKMNQHLIDRLSRMKPAKADIVIFGHSHRSCACRLDGTLYFNPGAVAVTIHRSREAPRIGRLVLNDDGGVDYSWMEV